MAQLFDNTTADFLSLADLSNARFQIGSTWTLCAFFRIENSSDQRGIVAKWGINATRQFIMRTGSGAAPQPFEIHTNVTLSASTGSIDLNTWYLAVCFNDGLGGANGMKVQVINMDGTYAANTTHQHDGDNGDLTEQITIGVRNDSGDPMDGDIAYVAYFNTELTDAEALAYLQNPYAVVFSKGSAGVEYFIPIYGDASPEPELVHGRDFTINGSQVKGTNPPLGPFTTPFTSVAASASVIAQHAILGFMVPR